MKAACLRGVALRLCISLCFALLLVPAYVVAPILFAKAPSYEMAGMLAGHIFYSAGISVLVLSLAIAIFFWRQQQDGKVLGWKIWAVLGVMVGSVAANVFGVGPVIMDIKAQALQGISNLAADDPLRMRFGAWHGVSSGIHLLSTIASALLLVMYGGHTLKSAKTNAGDACTPRS